MHSRTLLVAEFMTFFVLLPVSFAWEYSIWVKAGFALAGLTYIIVRLVQDPDQTLSRRKNFPGIAFWKRLALQFIILAIVTTLFVLWKAPSSLFCVPKSDPELFVKIIGVYTILSVWPQELIYRTYFFSRFESLFDSKNLMIFVNAVVFSLAHLFFKNSYVMLLTFVGGLLFAYTYFKTRSTVLVSIEHAVYGNWLFAVGLGDMLAFPGMDTCAG